MQAPVLRWGVMGPGWIAHRFVEALQAHTKQRVVAVGSRNPERAASFAERWSIDNAYGSYDDLLADQNVDIVYVATPHTEHLPCALAALAAGKHVLVEKPLGLSAAQGVEIANAATARGLFAGEAMWTAFLPKYDVIGQILDAGLLGTIRTVLADHGEHFTPDHRIYDPALAGGPLLDLGTYTAAFATWALGAPISLVAVGQPANEQLNGQISAILTHAGENQSMLNTTILANTPTTAAVCGDLATLTIPGPFYQPGPFTVTTLDGAVLRHDEPVGTHVDGLHFAADDAARTIADGGIESAVHPLAAALTTLSVLDEIRAQLGIEFPGS
ncbi:MAG TPA: Gfo/Idh/MocA family oxidoreductase [Aldersonia sp.]